MIIDGGDQFLSFTSSMTNQAANSTAILKKPAHSLAMLIQGTTARRLHIGHFAFMRAVVQGLDTRESWNRYLRVEGEHDDVRNVNRTIQWIRDEFAAAARRSDRHGLARLIRIDPNRIEDKSERLPSLEEYALAHGLEDFSQAEQIEHYQSRYGSQRATQSRRRRLISKQLEALHWLEALAVQPPLADDPVSAWFNPDLAQRLEAAGLTTLRSLFERINGIGFRWWVGVKAIGKGKAERIVAWLQAHEHTIGMTIGQHVNAPRTALGASQLAEVVPAATAVVPIEKLIVPHHLDGSSGTHRLPQQQCAIPASNDVEAIFSWIQAKGGSAPPAGSHSEKLTHTQRSYLREAERFLLWAVVQRRIPLSSVELTDCQAYLEFLSNPAPVEQWCGKRGREKWSPLWRPFEGPLSTAARRHACTVLKSLYAYLVEQHYLDANPWAGASVAKHDTAAASAKPQEKCLTPEQWRHLWQQAASLPDNSVHRRLKLALKLFETTGLRLADIVSCRVDALHRDADAGWSLIIDGSGSRGRQTFQLDDAFVRDVSAYLESRSLHSDPTHPSNHGVFLLGRAADIAERAPWSPARLRDADPKAGITSGTLYGQLKTFFDRCAVHHAEEGMNVFSAASTEWLRQVKESGN